MDALHLKEVRTVAADKGCISFISGKFNVIHPGHLRLFRFAKEISDYLVVGIYPDGEKGDFLLSEEDRLDGICSNQWVDAVFVLRESVANAVSKLKPNIVVKGKEHEDGINPEQEVVNQYGGVLRFASGDSRFTSLELLRAEVNTRGVFIEHAVEFLERRSISFDRLRSIANDMSQIRTLVVGDLIVDKYVDCEPIGMSKEDPTLVVTPFLEQSFIGGAGIVAMHAASIGKKSNYLSITGNDLEAESANEVLLEHEVNTYLVQDGGRPTTVKTRYRAEGKTLLRVNTLLDHEIDIAFSDDLLARARGFISDVDLLILSDFSYGLFSDRFRNSLIEAGKSTNLIITADSQTSSQLGDISKFVGLDLLTPTEMEARLAVGDKRSGLVAVSQKLQGITNAKHVLITLGSEGVFVHDPRGPDLWDDDRIPALNYRAKDVAGAGDALLTGASLALSTGANIWEAAYIGSIMAACQVNNIGNIPIDISDLSRAIQD